jgi:hypothetical protein
MNREQFAEEFTDPRPRHPFGTSCGDGVDDLSFAARSCECCAFEKVFVDGAFVAGLWFVALETLSGCDGDPERPERRAGVVDDSSSPVDGWLGSVRTASMGPFVNRAVRAER